MRYKKIIVILAAATALCCGCGKGFLEVETDVSTSENFLEESTAASTEETWDLQEVPADTEPDTEAQIEESVEPTTIEVIMIGDMLMHERVMDSGLQEDGSYDFTHVFAHVADKIEAADLAMVNQETILGGTELGLSGYPAFNSPYEVGVAEAEAGFDVILSATNHALDKGSKGVLRSVAFWEDYPEVSCIGIYDSAPKQEDDIYLYQKDDIIISVLNYTYGTNGIQMPADMPYLVNYLSEDKVIADIARAEELSDFVIVCPHWGTEYSLTTDSLQKKWTKIFLENGVDLVIGTHPHVIEPVEWVSDDHGNEMLVYYSLGNFINGTSGTGAGVANRMVGGMADVTIGRNEEGAVSILEYDVIPLVCHIGEKDAYTTYYLSDYTQELAEENKIISQASDFSLEYCNKLVENVWKNAGE